jgi:hypothetical protein
VAEEDYYEVWRLPFGDRVVALLFSPRAKRVRNISIALPLMPVMRTHRSPTATSDTPWYVSYISCTTAHLLTVFFTQTSTSTRPPPPDKSSPNGKPSQATPRSSTRVSLCWSTTCGSSLSRSRRGTSFPTPSRRGSRSSPWWSVCTSR